MFQVNGVKRRHLLTAAAAGATALGLPGRLQAKMASGLPQAPYFYRFKLGTPNARLYPTASCRLVIRMPHS